jgi:hypothetical protein
MEKIVEDIGYLGKFGESLAVVSENVENALGLLQ